MNIRKFTILLVYILTVGIAYAQRGSVEAKLDSMTIFIGSQVGLNVEASFPEGENAVLVALGDTVTSDIEIVERMPADTSVQNGVVTLKQRYLVTAFDTGLMYIPALALLQMGDSTFASTSEMALNVINPFQGIQVDPQTNSVPMVDIKDAMDAPFQLRELLQYWPWAVGVVVLAGLVVLGVYLYRRHKAKVSGVVAKPKHVEPCDVVALRDLERIKEEGIWKRGDFKAYYSELTDVLRVYISERYSVNALESTSDEIMDDMRDALSELPEQQKALEELLRESDFVKFAKHEPLPDTNDMAMKHAVEFVVATKPQLAATENEKN